VGVEIDNLRAFCEVLETTIAGLTDVSGDLEEQADEHESLHDDMRQLLEKMHSEGGRIDEEADQAGPAVLNEVQELAEAVRGAHDTRLPAIQKDAHETSERFHEALAPRAAALQEGAEELEEQGFAPAIAVVERERSDFEAWTTEGENAVGPFVDTLEPAAADVDAEQRAVGNDTNTTTVALFQLQELAQTTLHDVSSRNDGAGHFFQDHVREVMNLASQSLQGSAHAVEAAAAEAHSTLEHLAQDAVRALEGEQRDTESAVEWGTHALDDAADQFGRAVSALAGAELVTASFTTVASAMADAEQEVEEIRAVLDGMATP
jgi:hypothetical protein